MRVARVAGERLDPVQLRHRRVIRVDMPGADLPVLFDLVQLAERDRREDVGEVRLVAGHGDVVERALAAPHHAQVVDRAREPGVVGRDHAALAGGDVLRRVEREAGRCRERPDLPAAICALDRVRRVLDHRQPELRDRVEVGRLAREVHGQDRLRARADERRHLLGIDVEIGVANVCEDRRCSGVDDDVRRRRPRDRRRDHLVSRSHAESDERQVHCGSSRGDGDGVLGADVFREAPLQLGRSRPRRQPARAQRLHHSRDLVLPEGGRLEAEEGAPRRSRRGSGSQQRGSVRV